MVQYCCVPYCRNNALIPGISLHSIPRDEKIRKLWIFKMKRDERKNKKISSSMRVCSEHFLPSDYRNPGVSKIKCLKKDAVPSVFTFASSKKLTYRRPLVRHPLLCVTKANQDQIPIAVSNDSAEVMEQQEYELRSSSSEQIASAEVVDQLQCKIGNSSSEQNVFTEVVERLECETRNSTELGVADAQVQTDIFAENFCPALTEEADSSTNEKIQSLENEILGLKKTIFDLKSGRLLNKRFTMDVVKEDLKLFKYYTGFDNMDVFDAVYKYITADETVSYSKKLDISDQILLVLCKIRQNNDFTELAFKFNIAEKTVDKLFSQWINLFYYRLGSLCIWPHRDIIFYHSPEIFKQHYPDTFMLLDAIELKIERPSSLVLQSQSYSNYKSTNTVKGLVGCDPNGAVIFVSQLFMGNISDKQIVEDSGLLDVLKDKLEKGHIISGDAIMADKGFNIQNEIEALGLSINIPPLASSLQLQFEKEEVLQTRKIAACRVHVERAIRRIKCFKILADKISVHMLPHINQIWTVCSILSNTHIVRKLSSESQNAIP